MNQDNIIIVECWDLPKTVPVKRGKAYKAGVAVIWFLVALNIIALLLVEYFN